MSSPRTPGTPRADLLTDADRIQCRAREDQRNEIDTAARAAGMRRGPWLLDRALAAARFENSGGLVAPADDAMLERIEELLLELSITVREQRLRRNGTRAAQVLDQLRQKAEEG